MNVYYLNDLVGKDIFIICYYLLLFYILMVLFFRRNGQFLNTVLKLGEMHTGKSLSLSILLVLLARICTREFS